MNPPNEEQADHRSDGHFVYIYHEEGRSGRPVYIGYGRSAMRASQHLVASHNPALNQFLASRRYRISIAGPFSTEETGRAVETALISALEPIFNENGGERNWRFRPLGVPVQFGDRQTAAELALPDFLTAQGPSPRPVLFVIVNTLDLAYDGRAGYDPATPPEDAVVRIRVDRWWQLGKLIPGWIKAPDQSPGVLVGVFGSPGRQTVIASLQIDQSGWATAERRPDNQGRVRVPLISEDDLDAFSLRGGRISPSGGLKFGSFSTESFAILNQSGCLGFGRAGTRPKTERQPDLATAHRAAKAAPQNRMAAPYLLPPLAEQTRILAAVERRLSVVEELESVVSANLQRATRLRQSILQKAFTGKLV